jgi:hypothetical protein
LLIDIYLWQAENLCVVSVRRVLVQMPESFPFLPTYRQVALALGTSPG